MEERNEMKRKLVFLAVLAACGAAQAEEDGAMLKPESQLGVGVSGVSGNEKDRALYGVYNGQRKESAELQLDVDLVKRDDATGTWTLLQGRNLGRDDRELSGTYQKQGDWKATAEYSELVKREPRSMNTGQANAGTATPTVQSLATVGGGGELNPALRRKGVTVGAEKWLNPQWMVEASFKEETKEGTRLFGRGIACGVYASANNACGTPPAGGLFAATAGGLLLLPEPIDYNSKQFEAKLNYNGDNLKLHLGYYGSFFTNGNGTLSPTLGAGVVAGGNTVVNNAGTTLADLLRQPIALAPDNQAHQVYVSGTYALTATTRANFKLAQTHATQHDDFAAGLTPPAGVRNLGGEVDTTLAQVGVTARPWSQLSLVANLRYEDRDDKTAYALLAPQSNSQNSQRKLGGKAEASYQLPDNYRATVGVDYQSVHRQRPVGTAVWVDAGFSGLREETKEVGYRGELRRTMSETLNASVSISHSKRDGSGWLSPTTLGFPAVADSAIAVNGTVPRTLEDRERDKLRLMAEWTPQENLSLQFVVEDGKDSYTGPTAKGLRDSDMQNYGIDAVWKLTEQWKLTGYWNQGKQTQHVDHSIGYLASLRGESTTLGLGVTGKIAEKYEVGADLLLLEETNKYQMNLASGGALTGGGLPDVNYRLKRLKLYGKRALNKDADIRIEVMHQRAKLEEWSWGANGTAFAYADNSSVSLQPSQNLSYIGATYIYKLK